MRLTSIAQLVETDQFEEREMDYVGDVEKYIDQLFQELVSIDIYQLARIRTKLRETPVLKYSSAIFYRWEYTALPPNEQQNCVLLPTHVTPPARPHVPERLNVNMDDTLWKDRYVYINDDTRRLFNKYSELVNIFDQIADKYVKAISLRKQLKNKINKQVRVDPAIASTALTPSTIPLQFGHYIVNPYNAPAPSRDVIMLDKYAGPIGGYPLKGPVVNYAGMLRHKLRQHGLDIDTVYVGKFEQRKYRHGSTKKTTLESFVFVAAGGKLLMAYKAPKLYWTKLEDHIKGCELFVVGADRWWRVFHDTTDLDEAFKRMEIAGYIK